MKTIKYFIALFIFINVLSCTSDTSVEDGILAQEQLKELQSTGGETSATLDNERDG